MKIKLFPLIILSFLLLNISTHSIGGTTAGDTTAGGTTAGDTTAGSVNISSGFTDLLPPSYYSDSGFDSSEDKESQEIFDEIFNDDVINELLSNSRAIAKEKAIWNNTDDGARLDGAKLIIKVCWEPAGHTLTGSIGDNGRRITQEAAKAWENFLAIQFEGWDKSNVCTPNAPGIHIAAYANHPIGPHTFGIGSELDRRTNGMVLNFTDSTGCPNLETCIYSIAVHEFGHALGMEHEHLQLFTSRFTKLLDGQVKYFNQVCFNRVANLKAALRELNADPDLKKPSLFWWSRYDPNSVMNYCNNIRRKKTNPSNLDIAMLQRSYGSR